MPQWWTYAHTLAFRFIGACAATGALLGVASTYVTPSRLP